LTLIALCQNWLKTVPHIAFAVEDINIAIKGKKVLIKPNSPAKGTTVAFIEDNGAPIEFIQFENKEYEVWPNKCVYLQENYTRIENP